LADGVTDRIHGRIKCKELVFKTPPSVNVFGSILERTTGAADAEVAAAGVDAISGAINIEWVRLWQCCVVQLQISQRRFGGRITIGTDGVPKQIAEIWLHMDIEVMLMAEGIVADHKIR
jgi:hypothetical protein